MSFRQVDEADAYALASGDSPLLTYLADAGRAALEEATRGAVATYQQLYLPRLHSIPGGSGADATPAKELGWALYLWRPSKRGRGIKLETLGTAVDGDLTLGLVVMPLAQLIARTPLPPQITYVVSEGEDDVGLTLDNLSVQAGETYAVILTCESELATADAEEWHDSNADPASRTALEGWLGPGLYTSDTSYWSSDGSSFTAHTRNTTPWLIEFLDGNDPRSASFDASKQGVEPPAGRLAFRMDKDSNTHPYGSSSNSDAIWVWPPLEVSDTLYGVTGFTIRRTPLSYWEIQSVQITEIVAPAPSYGSALAPGSGFSATTVYTQAAKPAELATEAGRIHAIAPLPPMDTVDAASMTGFREHAGARVVLSTAYDAFLEMPVGDATRYSDGVSKALATYRCTLIGHLVAYHGSDEETASLHLKAIVDELDGTGADSTGEVELEGQPQIAYNSLYGAHPDAALWLGFQGPDLSRLPARHSLRGFWCNTAWRAGASKLIVADVEVTDDVDPDGDTRRLSIQAKRTHDAGGDAGDVHFFVTSLLVETRGEFRPATDAEV